MEFTKFFFVLFYAFIGLYLALFLSPNQVLIFDGIKSFNFDIYIKNVKSRFRLYFDKFKYFFDEKISKIKFRTLGYELKVRKVDNKQSGNQLVNFFSSSIFLYFLITIFFMFGSYNGYEKKLQNILPYHFLIPCLIISFLSIIFLKNKFYGFAFYLSLLFGSFLPFWLYNGNHIIGVGKLDVNNSETLIFLILSTIVFSFLMKFDQKFNNKYIWTSKIIPWAIFLLSVITLYIFSATVLLSIDSASPWHHWGVYVSSAQMLMEGAVPLDDFPMQYGLGPTLLISLGGIKNGFASLFYSTFVANSLLIILIATITCKIVKPKNWIQRSFILLFYFIIILVPMSSPGDVNAPNAYPSGNGLRFLPGVIMLFFTIYFRHNFFWFGHVLWSASFIWSPEAAIHTTCIWVPLYFWEKLKLNNDKSLLNFIKIGSRQLSYLILFLAFFAFIYYNIFEEIPDLKVYLTYYLNPVGLHPLNFIGIFTLLMLITSLWFFLHFKDKNFKIKSLINTRVDSWLVALLCYGNFSYCLGRSADGNLGVMLPYFGMMIFIVYQYTSYKFIRTLSSGLIASIIAWSFFPGTWQVYERALSRLPSLNSPQDIIYHFDRSSEYVPFFYRTKPGEEDFEAILDSKRARDWIHENYNEPVENYDHHLIDGLEEHQAWNGLHGPANYGFIKSDYRKLFLKRVSKRFKKNGWIIFDNRDKAIFIGPEGTIYDYLNDFETVYRKDKHLTFGKFTAIRFTYKN